MPKRSRSNRPGKPPRQAEAPPIPSEIQAATRGILQIARESPEGWGTVAQALREQGEFEPEVMLEFLARSIGKEVLPLLRGLALEDDDAMAEAALKALPLLGTRSAGEALVEAYAAHAVGARARLAWEGVQALQSRGINVSVPEPEQVRVPVPALQIRECWESFPDGVGSRETAVRAQDRYGVWHTILICWNDQAGVKDGFIHAMSRREWEEVRRLNEEQEILLVKVPDDFARWQISRAREINERTGFPLKDHLEAWDEAVGPAPGGYEPPDPRERIRTLPDEQLDRLRNDVPTLLELPAFASWAFEPADLRPWLDQWLRLMGDTPAGAENFVEVNLLTMEAARSLATPPILARYRDRLLDCGRKFAWIGRETEADLAAALAEQIEGAADPGEVRFLGEMAFNGLEMLEEMLDEGEDPESLRYDPMQSLEE
jgi:hypothetical protein